MLVAVTAGAAFRIARRRVADVDFFQRAILRAVVFAIGDAAADRKVDVFVFGHILENLLLFSANSMRKLRRDY